MNILFVANDPTVFDERSATRARMRSYAREVEALGGVLHILSRGPRTETVTDGPLVLHGIKAGKLAAFIAMRRMTYQLVQAEHIAIVSAQDPFEHGWIAWRGIQGTSVKLHLQVHTDFLSPWFSRFLTIASLCNRVRVHMAGILLPHAQGIRVVSRRIKQSVEEKYGESVTTPSVLPIAVPSSSVESAELTAFPFTLIAIGRLEEEKRVRDLIAAISILAPDYPDIGLVIVGDGRKRRSLERMVARKEIGQQVTFLGNRPDARGLLAQADGFVQASAYEGYGITLIEAALANTPTITTEVGIVGEVLVPNEHVLTVPVADPAALAVQIRMLKDNPEAAEQRAQAAHLRVTDHLEHVDSSPHAIISDIARLV